MTTETRELKRDEFYLAEKLWEQYRGQKADPDLYLAGSSAVIRARMIWDMEPWVPVSFTSVSGQKSPENLTADLRSSL